MLGRWKKSMLGHRKGELGSHVIIWWLWCVAYVCTMRKAYLLTHMLFGLNLSKYVNVIICFVKELVFLLKHFFKNYFKCLKWHDMDTITVKFTESEKKETGVRALSRHSRMLLLWQTSEPHWAFAP